MLCKPLKKKKEKKKETAFRLLGWCDKEKKVMFTNYTKQRKAEFSAALIEFGYP